MNGEPNGREYIEEEGKTVDDAVEKALEKLRVSRDMVDVEVLDPGSKGFLNMIGGKDARVRVTVHGGVWEERVREVVSGLIDGIGVSAKVEVETVDQIVNVRIDSAGSDGLLIGRRGDTLTAIQHLVTRMVNKDNARRIQVVVDVGGYKKRREAQLENLARSLATRVESTGQQVLTEPLSAAERRVIHITLSDNPAVRTETIGDGLMKKVAVIRVKDGAGAPRQSPGC
jgi:spoIIIJ-associated protein